ncbi:sarcospan [Ochotona curzoniae]|uniref:sarcospan n=1 Tax=Ochotona curzoniae TaxID=130825 RepID=UPI001B350163|nr:sarcospan [Ochotona curzoniae]
MGKDRQPRGQQRQGAPPAADAAGPDDPGLKKGAGTREDCGDEEARTCCGCRFPLLLALLQLALGIAVTVVGFLMASISSSLLVRATPFWAGIIVCVVAYLGLFMLCVSYQVDERTCIQFSMKLLYFVLSALGLMVCVLAVAFAAHHYSQLSHLTCEDVLDSCQCKLPSSEPLSRTFVYRNVTDCSSITGTFQMFLIIQMVLNLVCGLVCLVACFVMWKHRYQVLYVGVRMCPLAASEGQQKV